MKMRSRMVTAALAAVVLTGSFGGVTLRAEDKGAGQFTVTVPQTAGEHLAMAQTYKDKAAAYRADAEFHRKMLADYMNRVPANQKKSSVEYPWITKERVHCEAFIKDAERLANEADQFAQYHTMRGEELQGK